MAPTERGRPEKALHLHHPAGNPGFAAPGRGGRVHESSCHLSIFVVLVSMLSVMVEVTSSAVPGAEPCGL